LKDKILQLYPTPSREVSLRGLYLEHDLRAQAEGLNRVFVCANFVGSLDGRIAVPDSSGKGVTLAEAITNPRDWRLFQELAVQTDILITSGRYLRQYATGVRRPPRSAWRRPFAVDFHNKISRSEPDPTS